MRFGLFATLAITFLLPLGTSAQALGGLGNATESSFTFSVNPKYPAAHSSAVISLFSNSIDLNAGTLTVTVAGKETYKGAVRPFSVPLGAAGKVVQVKAAVTVGGSNYSQTIALQAQDVVLIAEPISSAPPLYPGKSSVPLEGSTRVVAVANLRGQDGKATNPATYSYTWTVDDTTLSNSSGIGKSSIIVASPLQYRTREVSVVVTSAGGGVVGGAAFTLSGVHPTTRIYENDPLLGIRYERALATQFSITGAESTLFAAPFSLPTTGGAPRIEWFLNGASAQSGSSITLRPTGSGRGSASLSLVTSAGELATDTTLLSLIFGENTGTNIFGL